MAEISTDEVHLTPREQQVLAGVMSGLTAREIGVQLYISRRTVEIHKQNISAKLRVINPRKAFRDAVARAGIKVEAFIPESEVERLKKKGEPGLK